MQANPKVFMDIQIGSGGDAADLGRIVIELKVWHAMRSCRVAVARTCAPAHPRTTIHFKQEDVCPKTAENFKELCVRPAGNGYKSSIFHRIIPSFMCQVLHPVCMHAFALQLLFGSGSAVVLSLVVVLALVHVV
jgi:hypothetical protein